MFHPNRRYGNPEAFRALTQGIPTATLAAQLHRHARTIDDWKKGKRRVPYWVIELLEMRQRIALIELRQMGIDLGPRRLRATKTRGAGQDDAPASPAQLPLRLFKTA